MSLIFKNGWGMSKKRDSETLKTPFVRVVCVLDDTERLHLVVRRLSSPEQISNFAYFFEFDKRILSNVYINERES